MAVRVIRGEFLRHPALLQTFQFGCALTLTNILHLSKEFSLAYGLAVHALQTATLVLITIGVLAFSGQGLKGIVEKSPKD